jgi:hypothetical protein
VSRKPWTSSMIAMALLACGESVARAQEPLMKIPEPPPKPKPPEPLKEFDVVRAAWQGFEPYDPEDVPVKASPPTQPTSKPRSKSGQRRAHARSGR